MRTVLLSYFKAKESEENRKNSNKHTNALCQIAANLKVEVKYSPHFYKLFKSEGKREKEGIPISVIPLIPVLLQSRLTGGEMYLQTQC